MAKGRAHDLRVNARAIAAVRWVTVAALLAVAALWSQIAPYEVILRSVIVLGALGVTLHALPQKALPNCGAVRSLCLGLQPCSARICFFR